MSWGGSVLGMINSLKANARKRPSLRKGFMQLHAREAHKPIKIKSNAVRPANAEDLKRIRLQLKKERQMRTIKLIGVFVVSVAITILFIHFFIDVSLNHQRLQIR